MFILKEFWKDFKCRFGFLMLNLAKGVGLFAAGAISVAYWIVELLVLPFWMLWTFVKVFQERDKRQEKETIEKYLGK